MTNSCVNIKLMYPVLQKHVCTSWNQDIFNVDKQQYGIEHYVKVVTNKQHKAALSQFRSGNREISKYCQLCIRLYWIYIILYT